MTEGMPCELIYDTCACTTIRMVLPDSRIDPRLRAATRAQVGGSATAAAIRWVPVTAGTVVGAPMMSLPKPGFDRPGSTPVGHPGWLDAIPWR